MKISFVVMFLVQGVLSNDGFLYKFHQTGFKIKDVIIQLIDYDKDVFYFAEVKTFKFNRTTTAHNITTSLKVDVKDAFEILIQGYKFLSNEFRHFPLRFQVNLKRSADLNAMGLGHVKECGNVIDFYFYKNITYHTCNYVVDATRFPPLIPNGRYKFDLTILYLNKEVSWTAFYCEIYTPIKYPKK